MTPDEIKQRLIDENRCKCGRKLQSGKEKCRFCIRFDKQFQNNEPIIDPIPVCSICKTECEYVWFTKNGVTKCINCLEVIA